MNQLIDFCHEIEATPLLVEAVPESWNLNGKSHETLAKFYNDSFFESSDSVAKQLWFLSNLFENGNAIASIGMMSGAMDGLAMFARRRTIFFAHSQDAKGRMAHVANAIDSLTWLPLSGKSQDKFEKFTKEELALLKIHIFCGA